MKNNEITLPHDPIKERAVIATLIKREDIFPRLCQKLEAEDFLNLDYQRIFCAIVSFYRAGKSVDLTDLINACQANGVSDAFFMINELRNEYSFAYHHDDYIDELKKKSLARSLIMLGQHVTSVACLPDTDPLQIGADAIKKIYQLQGKGMSRETKSFHENNKNFEMNMPFVEHFDWMNNQVANGMSPYIGVPCRYPILDETFGYFKKGCLYYVGARTSMGKTTFALNLICNQIRAPAMRVGMFSLEMTRQQIHSKLICLFSDIPYWKFEDVRLNDEQKARVCESSRILDTIPFFCNDNGSLTVEQLAIEAQRMVDQHKIEILYVDYLTRLRAGGKFSSKHLEVDTISKTLQRLAKELNIPIVCLCQLNRGSLNRASSRPSLSDFRESGSIEEDCDGAILIHRPEYYVSTEKPGMIEIIVAKNRLRGILKTVDFQCDKNISERYWEADPLKVVVQRAFGGSAPDNSFDEFTPSAKW